MLASDISALSPMQKWLAKTPNGPVYRIDDHVISREALLTGSQKTASYLYALGFRQGDALCLLVPDSVVWLQFLFAASQLGVLIVPISTRYREVEIAHVLETARAKGIVYMRQFLKSDFHGIVGKLASTVPSLKHLIPVDTVDGLLELPEHPALVLPAPAPDAPLCTFSTSGTTGMPKLAVHTQAAIARHATDVAAALEMDRSAVTLCALPLYGVLGFVSAMATIAGGGLCIAQPVFKAEPAADIIDKFGVTHFYGSDGLLDAALRVQGHKFERLRRGGFAEFAGLGRRLAEFAESRFGLKLCAVYGSSECFALMALRDPGLPLDRRITPGGRPTSADITFRVVDSATGVLLADGTPGELQIRGHNVTVGYLNNNKATLDAMTVDGWFRTGDLAYGDGESFVFLARMKDSLRLKGYLVDPTEIELFLTTHRSIGAAQVVGVHREGRGDVAVAFVRQRVGAPSSEEELIEFCAKGISNYKVPSRIVFVDEFPEVAGPNGVKIQKNKLRDIADSIIEKEARI